MQPGIKIPPLLPTPVLSNPIPTITHDPSTITTDIVNVTGFIKYSKLTLTTADNILLFYENAQALQYNIVLILCENITPDSGIFHLDIPPTTEHREVGVIDKDFTEAHGLLITTNLGSEFIYQLLMMEHLNLVSISLATIDIPTYSTTKWLYKYAKGIMNYVYVQSINKRPYSQRETSFIYLNHLDSPHHTTLSNSLCTVIETTPDPIPMK